METETKYIEECRLRKRTILIVSGIVSNED